MKLGCCYYPEHWPEELWADDVRRMAEMGLELVRIGEFAWSRIEPEPGRLDWSWLDRAIDTLAGAGLKIILGTPTATPPKWLVDSMPEMIAIDRSGQPRTFGSRRHYCFSHAGYREECRRIVNAMAERYGNHPALVMWQTDNEFGCHDTVLSFSKAAASAFRTWLEDRHGDINSLNQAWGNVFWSMEYRGFGEIDLPNLTVTEANPAHWLDYRRFASDQVASFNREQVDAIRQHSPEREITHNFMGFFTEFDHHLVGKDLDIAAWDSYPLGFLEQFWFTSEEKSDYFRQGHPDIAAFHHDLYRGITGMGRWGVMEQQPGPVNWARFNPAPLPGMVTLWTLEALAHGAEFTSYFRWRQAPFAQEQMHAGLLRPDGSEAEASGEARDAAKVMADIGPQEAGRASVALVFSYQAAWVCGIQPQGQSFRYLELVFQWYSALRRAGLNIDIVSEESELDAYQAIVIPSLPIISGEFVGQLAKLDCPILIGPRTGSKTPDFAIPDTLAPGNLRQLLPITVERVESLRDGVTEQGDGFGITRWFEQVASDLKPEIALEDGRGVVFRKDNVRYCAGWPDNRLLDRLIEKMADEASFALTTLTDGLRVRRTASHLFVFNYSSQPVRCAFTGELIDPAGVSITALEA